MSFIDISFHVDLPGCNSLKNYRLEIYSMMIKNGFTDLNSVIKYGTGFCQNSKF